MILAFFLLLVAICCDVNLSYDFDNLGNWCTSGLFFKVLREGRWVEEDAAILVPGDIISVKLGDIIPADSRLLDGDPLKIDQVIFRPSMFCADWLSGAVWLMFKIWLFSLHLQGSPFLWRKALVIVFIQVPRANKVRLRQWSLLLVFILSLARLLTLWIPQIKWDTFKR